MKITKQSVELLPGLTEQMVIGNYSEIMPTPYNMGEYDLEKTKAVIRSCVKRGHLSVLEHYNITAKIKTNIGTYKDYTRHRHCAFTIESTSFVKYNEEAEVILSKDCAIDSEEYRALANIMDVYVAHKNDPKHSRDLLPQCLAAKVIMTTNIRQWRWIIALRGDPNDNPLTIELRDKLWMALWFKYPFFFPLTPAEDDPMTIYNAWGPSHTPAVNNLSGC